MHVALEARLDRRGVTLQEEIDVPFQSVRQIITITTDADDALIAKVQGRTATGDALTRLMAIRELGRLKDKDALKALKPLLKSPVPFEKEYAAK